MLAHRRDLIFFVLFSAGFLGLTGFIVSHFNGTGDAGDSILHYLFARYAPDSPDLYFNHWAKPLFTLVASPFAQFSFTVFKAFNACLLLVTAIFTSLSAKQLGIKNYLLIPFLFVASPLILSLSFSGLTEPLFAAVLSMVFYFFTKGKTAIALILISFLPFVRSEGLIIILATVLYLTPQIHWKQIALLSIGHILYMLVGLIFSKDILWVFTENPYAQIEGVYGSGSFFHFFKQMPFILGIPNAVLMGLGLLLMMFKIEFKKQRLTTWLVIVFLTFFFSHVIFWTFGLFNSLGLKRVFLAISPVMIFMVVHGIDWCINQFPKPFQKWVLRMMLGLILSFPFWNNPAALDLEKDLNLTTDQKIINQMCQTVKRKYSNQRLVTSHPHVSLMLDVNHFKSQHRIDITPDNIKVCKENDLIFWENHIAQNDYKVTFKDLNNHQVFSLLELKTNGTDTSALFQRNGK